MEAQAHQIAEGLRSADRVGVYCHIDADGVTGGAIASDALSVADIADEIAVLKKLDEASIQVIRRESPPVAWFVDFGAGQLHHMEGLDAVITDHHVPTARDIPMERRRDLVRFAEDEDRVLMLNPHMEGEGSDVVSGAGLAYAVAKALDAGNKDLAAVAIVGAVADVVTHMLARGCGWRETLRLVGEVYTLVREPVGSPTRDAKEFGTLINACGRYEAAEVGYRVCRGDRGEALESALRLLAGHREHLVSSLDWIEQVGLSQLDALQYFHAEDKIRDTVVGIAAGIALQSSGNRQIPILAFAYAPDGVKVSARASRELVARGLDLAAIMREASKRFGGEGGGHHGAAGATIPRGTEVEFAKAVDGLVKAQLSGGGPASEPCGGPSATCR